VTYALVSELSESFHGIHSIKIYMSAGNKNKAGVSTFESILSYAGTQIRVWSNGQWENFMGWALTEIFNFPPPVGRRFVQLCNVPDLELFPKLFEADQVIFKAGVELPIFNIGLSILAQLKKYIPEINLPSMAEPLIWISRLFKTLVRIQAEYW
jgi:saccharopine dehydrogenase-like NADP-dependent oxidoreductase